MTKETDVEVKRSEAQIEADKRYEKKRIGTPRLPASRLTEKENKLMNKLYKKHGGDRKEAILEAADCFINMSK